MSEFCTLFVSHNLFLELVIDTDPVGADNVMDNNALRDLLDVLRLGY